MSTARMNMWFERLDRLIARLWALATPVYVIVMLATLSFIGGVMITLTVLVLHNSTIPAYHTVGPNAPPDRITQPMSDRISSIFTPEVRYWEAQIIVWSRQYQIDPNMIATVMQIESCGDPDAGSIAGAQGLFQVMPFHFAEGANPKDPEENAGAGLPYLKTSLNIARGHFGLALAGYNGGHGVIRGGWARWAGETRRYYLWGSGIYLDAVKGKTVSPSLTDWLNAGGNILCAQAAGRQAGRPTPTPRPPLG